MEVKDLKAIQDIHGNFTLLPDIDKLTSLSAEYNKQPPNMS